MAAVRHPDLTKAIDDFAAGNPAAIVRIGLRATLEADKGRYCECADPLIKGKDLMCGACLLRNRDQEIAAVIHLVEAHEFEPSTKFKSAEFNAHFCKRCMQSVDHERHHGVSGVGRTSWGTEVHPIPEVGA